MTPIVFPSHGVYYIGVPDHFCRAADYVHKIHKGPKAAELPMEQPSKFEWVLHNKTAGEIGIKIPQSTLVSADEVIG
jgi:putative ABC transport system substrate-binding protein